MVLQEQVCDVMLPAVTVPSIANQLKEPTCMAPILLQGILNQVAPTCSRKILL
jgi:hypothetical protein